MNQHRAVEKAIESIENQLGMTFTAKQYQAVATDMMGVFTAGYEKRDSEKNSRQWPVKRPVKQLNKNGEEVNRFDSAKQAAKFVGGNRSHITQCAKGKYSTHKGYYWVYIDE